MKKYIPIAIGLLAVALLLAIMAEQGRAQQASQDEGSSSPQAVKERVKSYIPVQGRLTDAGGNPLNGNYNLTLRFYTVPTGGTAICEDANTVQVVEGLFNTEIWGTCQDNITGDQLYLGIQVGGDAEMKPRQPIYAVPYAWSLRPGAVISASIEEVPNVNIETWSEGGIGLKSSAMAAAGENYGVYGGSSSPDGYGGYFSNTGGGIGLYGASTTITTGVGVKGESGAGDGIYGISGSGSGVYGASTTGHGVFGNSTNGNGVSGSTGDAAHNYGLYTDDNLYSLNFHLKGAVSQLVRNGGRDPLEEGDVVIFSGIIEPAVAGEPPVILVAKAAAAGSTAVAGVVLSRSTQDGKTLAGASQPGEYLLVVVQGPARIKASTAGGAIKTGDLLSGSTQPGVATKTAATALPGTVFAKALEALDSGEGWIYVYVTLH